MDYIGYNDKGVLLAGGCGSTNGAPKIDETDHLDRAYKFRKDLYERQGLTKK